MEAGFEGIGKSVKKSQNTVAQYIVTQPTLDLCERSTRRHGARVSRRWWERTGINLEGAKKTASDAETVSESESEFESESESEFESESESDSYSESESESESKSESESESESKSESESELELESESDADPGAGADTDADGDPVGEEELSGASGLSGVEWSGVE